MKKLSSIILCVMLAFGLSACGNSSSSRTENVFTGTSKQDSEPSFSAEESTRSTNETASPNTAEPIEIPDSETSEKTLLNCGWLESLFRGKYTPVWFLQTATAAGVLMIGSAVSGVILSRYTLSFLPIEGRRALARTLHLLFAYWEFVLMSFRLTQTARTPKRTPSTIRTADFLNAKIFSHHR